MSSFFNWLCFPNRRTRSKRKTKWDRNQDDEGGFTSIKQKRKLSRLAQPADHIRKQASFNERERNYPITSETKQPDSSIPNKRRRVQDIFNVAHSDCSNNVQDSEIRDSTTIRTHADFGSEYTPRIYCSDQTSFRRTSESMYGYVPKIVQTCSASKALEGDRVDDFFSHLHEDNSLHQFGKMNSRNFKHSPLVPRFTLPHSQSQTSILTADKMSLIESEETPNVLDYCQFPPNISSRVNSILEASFDSMWNSNGEVLY